MNRNQKCEQIFWLLFVYLSVVQFDFLLFGLLLALIASNGATVPSLETEILFMVFLLFLRPSKMLPCFL